MVGGMDVQYGLTHLRRSSNEVKHEVGWGMAKRKTPEVHVSIKAALGYDPSEPDSEVLDEWKARTRRVCKPCWELKYCPYGPFVEQSPTLPSLRHEADDKIAYFKDCIETGLVGSKNTLSEDDIERYKAWLDDDELLLEQAITALRQKRALELASQERRG
jgi:hypothetical protein